MGLLSNDDNNANYCSRRGADPMAVEAYCMKCKEKKTMKDPVAGTTKNGKPITKGTCPVCGSTICRIGSMK